MWQFTSVARVHSAHRGDIEDYNSEHVSVGIERTTVTQEQSIFPLMSVYH